MEKYQMPAEIERLQKEADALLTGLTGDNIIQRLEARNRLILRISNMKKWLKPASTADQQMSYGVTYHGKTAL